MVVPSSVVRNDVDVCAWFETQCVHNSNIENMNESLIDYVVIVHRHNRIEVDISKVENMN